MCPVCGDLVAIRLAEFSRQKEEIVPGHVLQLIVEEHILLFLGGYSSELSVQKSENQGFQEIDGGINSSVARGLGKDISAEDGAAGFCDNST